MKQMKIGIDMVRTPRFARLMKKEGFLTKHFSEYERSYIEKKQRLQTLAGIFCAKEAFLKAIGVGVLNGIELSEVEVFHHPNGQPFMKLSERILKEYGVKQVQISITHDGNFASAVCVVI